MRGDIVHRVYGVHEGREQDQSFGAFRTIAEAEVVIAKMLCWEMNGGNWAKQYHNRGFVIRQAVVETDFEIPPRPKPRDRYFVQAKPQDCGPGIIAGSVVEVFRRSDSGSEPEKVCEYERNYDLLQTFEPFRQGGREFALISLQYTGTSVLDLATGDVIAEESASDLGFCPVGFYVPDWWDLHRGTTIPGSEHWGADYEWPCGEFGFVWGCVWGDDSSWKVQYLDLSGIQSGLIRREERFGYVELATDGYRSPCFDPQAVAPPRGNDPPPFIKLKRNHGKTDITFAVELQFDFVSGTPTEWQRVRFANFE